jgi:uncharacterized protein YukE
VTFPANYDTVQLQVDPDTMHKVALAVTQHSTNIANYLNDINSSLSSLNVWSIAWTGPSAQSAAHFNTQWTTLMRKLFGTPDVPGTGVLNVLMGGLGAAALNEEEGETLNTKMFNGFATGSSGGSKGFPATGYSDGSSAGSVFHVTSVDEFFGSD